jgi:hypothetical protein
VAGLVETTGANEFASKLANKIANDGGTDGWYITACTFCPR